MSPNVETERASDGSELEAKYPIIYYGLKSGLIGSNYDPNQDISIRLPTSGAEVTEYIYSQKYDSLKCNDRSGLTWFSKESKERFSFIHELKKLYLENEQNLCLKRLEEGKFTDNDLDLGYNSRNIDSLQEKIKSIDKLINTLDGNQSWYDQIVSFENVVEDLKNSGDSEAFKKIRDTHNDSIQKLMKTKNGSRPDITLQNVMNEIKYECLLVQRSQIEKELNKTKFIELEIIKKRKQLKNTQFEFDEEYQISDTEEMRYKRLLNLQERRTAKEYRDGMKRTKEMAEDKKFHNIIKQSKYNAMNEMKDLIQITNTRDKEYSKIKNLEEIIFNYKNELENIEEHLIPTLEEEHDLLGEIKQKLDNELVKLNRKSDKFQNKIVQVEREITKLDKVIRLNEIKIISIYETLNKLLEEIRICKDKILELQSAKNGVRQIEIDAFKDRIFEQAGGRKKGGAAEGFVNHETCPPDVPKSSSDNHCRYRAAIEETVEFSLSQIDLGRQSLDTNALWNHLDGYKHSAAGGKGQHKGDLRDAGTAVFQEHTEVQNKIRKKEKKYQDKIDEHTAVLQTKEFERDRVRVIIIDMENTLNNDYIKLERFEKTKDMNSKQKSDRDDEIDAVNDCISRNNALRESIQEEISTKMDRVSDIITEMSTKREEIRGLSEMSDDSQLVHAEVRWRYAQYETIISNIGILEKQTPNHDRLLAHNTSVESSLKENRAKRHNLENDLKSKEIEMASLMIIIESKIKKRNSMIEKRASLETTSNIGLVNTVKHYIAQLKRLKKHNNFLITQYNRTKSDIIMRKTYKKLDLTKKGTIRNSNGSVENIGNINTLFKSRMHKDCQDVFDHVSQGCMYYDAIHFISKALITNPNLSKNQILSELESKHQNYKNHVLVKHREDVRACILLIKTCLERFDLKIMEINTEYSTKAANTSQALELDKKVLQEKRRLDGLFTIMNFIRRTDELDKINIDESLCCGADCVSLEREELYLQNRKKMSVSQFAKKMSSQNGSLEEIEQELVKLFESVSSHKDVALEQVLLQTKDSKQKNFYKILVQNFDKIYLKKKLEILNRLNNLASLEYEARNIKREIAKIDKEHEQLFRTQVVIVHCIEFSTKEIGLLESLDELENFERMKQFCTNLCNEVKIENNKAVEEIKNYNHEIKELKNKSKTIRPNESQILNIKYQVLNNSLRVGLNTSGQQHRLCTVNCDFYETAVKLIDSTILEIKNGHVCVPAPGYKVAAKYTKKLIEQLKMSEHVIMHRCALKKIIEHVVEIYRREQEIAREDHDNIISGLELNVARLEFQVNSKVEHMIPQLEYRIVEINNYFVFRRDAEFIGKPSDQTRTSDELSEYKTEKIEIDFKTQVELLIQCFEMMNVRVQSNSLGKAAVSEFLKCIHKFFNKIFYRDLRAEGLITNLIGAMRGEFNNKLDFESKMRYIMRTKTKSLGGIEYILEKLSRNYKQTPKYNESLDPIKIYETIIRNERQRKIQIEESTINGLENDILALEAQMKEVSLKDTTILREKLENINTCLKCIEKIQEVNTFRNRLEGLNDMCTNRDNYYVFNMEGMKLGIRLIKTDQAEKSVEIREIDKILDFITQQGMKLLEYRVLKEKYEKELSEEIVKKFESEFLGLQRKLLVKGISLSGYDSFDSGESLDEINSFISVIISCLIGENFMYQVGCLNGMSTRIEEWTRKIRIKYSEQANGNKGLEFILRKINEEFKTDSRIIRNVNIITNNIQIELHEQGKNISLIKYDNKYFVLVPYPCRGNDMIDTSIKINIIVGILQTEEDLFKNVCERRICGQGGVPFHECKTLAQIYKKEKQNLTKIFSIKDFNIFCHEFDSENNYLFTYLSYLEKLDNGLVDPEEKVARVKTIKNFYDRILITMIKSEQKRRQIRNVTVLNESQEELYLKEFIKGREEDNEALKEEMLNFEEKIARDQYLVNDLLSKKESHRDMATERIGKLRDITSNIKNRLNELTNRISQLKRNEVENQGEIETAQAEIVGLETQLANVAEEIRNKQKDVQEIEIEITNLKNRTRELNNALTRMNELKSNRERDEEKIKIMIDSSKNSIKLIENLKTVLSLIESPSRKINEIVNEKHDVISIFECLKTNLEIVNVQNSSNLWHLLIKDVNYEQFIEYIHSDGKLAGESQLNFINRLRAIVKSSIHFDCEIVQELNGNKSINRFKVLATNVSYDVIHLKVKEVVESKLKGLTFKQNVLHSKPHSVTGIQDLTPELKKLVERRIELFFKSEEIESKKNTKYAEAAKIINQLQIDYKDVIKCFIDEIEIIASGKFLVTKSESYPGIDLTVNAVDMECIGENLEIDTSGKDGLTFKELAATHAEKKRNSDNKPRGDKGYDGYDGEHGGHGGNIVIKIENTIIGLEKLTIKANGGNGGVGQIGGNGDEGSKGIDGANGVADDTHGLGVGQTTIGFGSPGKPGGVGGSPGLTGRPGLGGKPGIIDIEHKSGKVQFEGMKRGIDAENVLNRIESRPTGGIGGEPGLQGLDQVKDKKSFFRKTKTMYTVVDRAALCKKYPKYRDEILSSGKITSTNRRTWTLLIDPLVFLVTDIFFNTRVSYEEGNNPDEYRNREKDSRRGRTNSVEAALRTDDRKEQEDKRDAVNVDGLHVKLNDKKNEDAETSGQQLHEECMNDLKIEQEEIASEIEHCTQEIHNIESDLQNNILVTEAKVLELENILSEINSLQNKETDLNSERTGRIRQVLSGIQRSQQGRDKTSDLNLDMQDGLTKLRLYNALCKETDMNKDDMIEIINEYLALVRGRLARDRHRLKFLRKNYASKNLDIKIMKKRLDEIRAERLSQIEVEVEIEQEIEEDIETQYVQEINYLIEGNVRKNYVQVNQNKQLNTDVYKTSNLHDVDDLSEGIECTLKQSIRYYRSSRHNDDTVNFIIQNISESTENINQKIINNYKREIQKIKMGNKLAKLTPMEISLVLNQFRKINRALRSGEFRRLDKETESFVLRLINIIDDECIIGKKLQTSFEDSLLRNSDIKNDIDDLIEIIENQKIFYLEKCAINFDNRGKEVCELMLKYNNDMSLENLVECVDVFGKYAKNIENKNCMYLKESVSNFISAVSNNIRHHALLGLASVIDLKILIERMSNIQKVINDLQPNQDRNGVLNTIIELVTSCSIGVQHLKVKGKSKKESNKEIKSLLGVTRKLVEYIGTPSIDKIVSEYDDILRAVDFSNIETSIDMKKETIISQT